MFFLSLISHLLCAWFALARPAYTTYKALVRDHDALTTLAMYWVVLALFFALEQSLGFVLSWLPFYWELRTLFLLYISLPQTQGATYIYQSFLEPWCLKNEADIDAAVVKAQDNAVAFARTRITALVDLLFGSLNKAAQSPDAPLKGLWDVYAPSVVAAFAPKHTSDGPVAGNDVAN